jgi:hypothetical protein
MPQQSKSKKPIVGGSFRSFAVTAAKALTKTSRVVPTRETQKSPNKTGTAFKLPDTIQGVKTARATAAARITSKVVPTSR